MNAVAALNFKNSSGNGANLYLAWILCTVLNAATVFVLIAAGLLAFRYFG